MKPETAGSASTSHAVKPENEEKEINSASAGAHLIYSTFSQRQLSQIKLAQYD